MTDKRAGDETRAAGDGPQGEARELELDEQTIQDLEPAAGDADAVQGGAVDPLMYFPPSH